MTRLTVDPVTITLPRHVLQSIRALVTEKSEKASTKSRHLRETSPREQWEYNRDWLDDAISEAERVKVAK